MNNDFIPLEDKKRRYEKFEGKPYERRSDSFQRYDRYDRNQRPYDRNSDKFERYDRYDRFEEKIEKKEIIKQTEPIKEKKEERKHQRKRKSLFDVSPQEMVQINLEIFPQLRNIQKDPKEKKTIIVGNIPSNVSEEEISSFFTNQIRKLLRKETLNPIKSTKISDEKTHCVIELEDEETASKTVNGLDGVKFLDEKLKLRLFSSVSENQLLPGVTVIPESANKVFIGGLPTEMNETQVKELLSQFGQIKAFNLVKDQITGVSKGYAFCDFQNEKVTDEAIAALNGKEVGSKILLVQRANVGAKVSMTPFSMSFAPIPFVDHNSSVAGIFNMGVRVESAIGSLIATKNLSNTNLPTKILVLYNLFRPEDYEMSSEEFKEFYEDVKLECKKFGFVKNFVIPKSKTKEGPEYPGKVFIFYETVEQCQRAQNEFAGRRFQGRIIITSYYSEEKFNKGIYY